MREVVARVGGAIAAVVLSGVMVNVAVSAPASAAKSCPVADAESINQFLADAAQAGWSEHYIERQIIKKWCSLRKVSTAAPSEVTPMTSVSDVDWYIMSMFYDHQIGRYVATATWKWTRQGFLDHDVVVCVNNNIGGTDGCRYPL